jgi:hypothetical protein
LAHFTTNKEESTRVTGITTKWKVMEHYSTPMGEWPIKVNGRTILFMVRVFSLMRSRIKSKTNTTLDLLRNVKMKNIGFHTMDGSRMIKNLDMGNYYLVIMRSMLGSLETTWLMEGVNFTRWMEAYFKVSGKITT